MAFAVRLKNWCVGDNVRDDGLQGLQLRSPTHTALLSLGADISIGEQPQEGASHPCVMVPWGTQRPFLHLAFSLPEEAPE